MSFFQKLLSFTSNKRQVAQEQASDVCTRDEDDFVHICPALSASSFAAAASVGSGGYADNANEEEESADISKWEMAEILNQRNKNIHIKKDNVKSQEETLERLRYYQDRSTGRLKKATVTEDPRPCMEDSRELEMFDDKKNRILKGSQRRKYLSYEFK